MTNHPGISLHDILQASQTQLTSICQQIEKYLYFISLHPLLSQQGKNAYIHVIGKEKKHREEAK